MRFYRAFLRVLPFRPRLALEALYWQITGRKKRARGRLRLPYSQSRSAYRTWIRDSERRRDSLAAAPAEIAKWPAKPLISVILYNAPEESHAHYERRLAALEAQIYPEWELVLAQSRETILTRTPAAPRVTMVAGRTDHALKALALGMAAATGDYVLPLAADALLAPDALFRLAQALQAEPDALVLYGDEDRLEQRFGRAPRRALPWFKPQWNAELFYAQDYLSGACLIRREAALAVSLPHPSLGVAGLYAWLLTLIGWGTGSGIGTGTGSGAGSGKIVHVPHVLAHRTAPEAELPDSADIASRAAAVAQIVAPVGAVTRPGAFGSVSVEWPLPEHPPLVSILIPTRDHVDLLRTCVAGVLTGTRYRNVEILIVDNGSADPATLAYLQRVTANPRVRVIRHDAPFNYSALNNLAAREARGQYLLLLNNDIEIIDENWLGWLVRQAVREGVGAVGAKLVYDDGSIQHAGVTIGIGDAAGHAHRFLKPDEEGYFARAHLPHYVSAVTGACLMVEKAKFEAVGGLDEEGFAVAFNDVDLCLKLQAAGWHNLYEPRAVLMHHESKSRGKDHRPDQIARYRRELALLQSRWGTAEAVDPLHHRALDRVSEQYLLQL